MFCPILIPLSLDLVENQMTHENTAARRDKIMISDTTSTNASFLMYHHIHDHDFAKAGFIMIKTTHSGYNLPNELMKDLEANSEE